MKRVLFPGRFQPVHKGHQLVFERLLRDFDEVVIAVGSAQEAYTCRNPFTAGERLEMWDLVAREMGSRDRVWIVPVPDLNMPLAWTSHILGLSPRVDAVASGNPHVQYLFKWLGVKTLEIELVNPAEYNGTYIRRLMVENNPAWRRLVPEKVASLIDRIGGVERVRRVCENGSGGNRW